MPPTRDATRENARTSCAQAMTHVLPIDVLLALGDPWKDVAKVHGSVCATFGFRPSTNMQYDARRFMLELLSDADTAGSPNSTLHRWLINDRRFQIIMEVGANQGATTCGLFQQKAFRIDAQATFGLDRNWRHVVLAVDNFLARNDSDVLRAQISSSSTRQADHSWQGKPQGYWQYVCNLYHAKNQSSLLVQDCPQHPQASIVPFLLGADERMARSVTGHQLARVRPELVYFNPPRDGFDSLEMLEYVWDAVLRCNGTFVGHGFERPVVQSRVNAFAAKKRLVVDAFWVHSPHTKWERVWPFDPNITQPFAAWAIRHKHTNKQGCL